jgi:hypothetical protein
MSESAQGFRFVIEHLDHLSQQVQNKGMQLLATADLEVATRFPDAFVGGKHLTDSRTVDAGDFDQVQHELPFAPLDQYLNRGSDELLAGTALALHIDHDHITLFSRFHFHESTSLLIGEEKIRDPVV